MSLTVDQQTLFTKLESGSYSLSQLTSPERQLITATLRPSGPFTEQQRELLTDWYLSVTLEQLSTANDALPEGWVIDSRIDTEGNHWLSADLLTDCAQPNDSYHAIAELLLTLTLTKKDDSDFPVSVFPGT